MLMDKITTAQRRPQPVKTSVYQPPETPVEPMEFLSRSWSVSALDVSKALAPLQSSVFRTAGNGGSGGGSVGPSAILDDFAGEFDRSLDFSGNPFSFALSETSQMVMDRIMSQSQEVSPRTSGRLSHSSGPLNSAHSCGSSAGSPPVSPSAVAADDFKLFQSKNYLKNHFRAAAAGGAATPGAGKLVGRWLKERKDKKKEETRAQSAQLHASITVAGVAAAIAAIAAATAASSTSNKDEQFARADWAIASAATLVAAQCVEAAEAIGADRQYLAAVLSSAVNVKSAADITTLTAAAATALRGAATLKARTIKDVWKIAAVIPAEKAAGTGGNNKHRGGTPVNVSDDNFFGICSREFLCRGSELLKRTRGGELHWKIVSVYINRTNQVVLKMKSKHVAGTMTKKKKNVVIAVVGNMPSWPGRHLLEGGEHRRYFGLNTVQRGIVEFECKSKKEHDIWTRGVSSLLSIALERNNKIRV